MKRVVDWFKSIHPTEYVLLGMIAFILVILGAYALQFLYVLLAVILGSVFA